MASMYDDNTGNNTIENIEDDEASEYGVRDGSLFIIDSTPPMFKEDPEEKITYFQKCFREYVNILREKLLWSRQDWVGLILFGTEKWDMDPEIKNVLTLHNLGTISVDKLKDAMEIYSKKWTYYKDISSSNSYPLDDVLWHAAQAFYVAKTMPKRRIILLTCQNDPQLSNDEKHRIRKKVESYNDLGLQLIVIRLGDTWKQDLFYKDLELLANNIKENEEEDYKPLTFEDIVNRVKHPAKIMAQLPLKFGEDVTLDVVVQNLCSQAKYLRKVKLDKETHVPLQTHTYFSKVEAEDDFYKDEEDDDDIPLPVLSSEIRKVQVFGGEDILFTPDEVQSLYNISEPGIEVIGTKPIQIDPMYHNEAPKFVTCKKDSNIPDNKLLFAAILDRCEHRDIMIICSVTFRRVSPPLLYSMIPNAKDGGFYLYRIPFRENVRDLDSKLSAYSFDDTEKQPPVDTEMLDVMEKIVEKIVMKYDPTLFSNPKLQVQLQNLETLALDLEQREPPADNTLPMAVVQEKIAGLINQLNDIVIQKKKSESDEPPTKKRRNEALDEHLVQQLVKDHKVESCTAPQLKDFLKTKNLKTSGIKSDLVSRIYDYYK